MGRRRQRGTKCEGQRDFRNVASPANPINRGPAVKNAGSETGRRDHRPMTGTRRGGVDVTGSALRRSCRAEPRCRPQIARPTKIPRASRSPQAPYHRVSLARCSARDRIRTCTPLRAPGPKPTRIPPTASQPVPENVAGTGISPTADTVASQRVPARWDVARHEDGTTCRGFSPRGWDHLVASFTSAGEGSPDGGIGGVGRGCTAGAATRCMRSATMSTCCSTLTGPRRHTSTPVRRTCLPAKLLWPAGS